MLIFGQVRFVEGFSPPQAGRHAPEGRGVMAVALVLFRAP